MESLITLIAVTTALLGSPGPAPLALAATGAVFGVRAGMPFLFGILFGIAAAIVATVVGLSVLLATYPPAALGLQILGGLYICYIAYKVATAPVLGGESQAATGAPTFLDGFILNLLNPKVYAAFLAIFSQFRLESSSELMSYTLTGVVGFLVAVVVDCLWLASGGVIRPWFQHPRWARMLRVSFAVMMLLAVAWALSQSQN